MTNADQTVSSVAPNPEFASKQAVRVRGFDGLRAIAFLLVFASHKIYFAHADSIGDIGVWLFFVLSGFLITRTLARSRLDIEHGLAGVSERLGSFYLRRTARIFPPYYSLLFFFVGGFAFCADQLFRYVGEDRLFPVWNKYSRRCPNPLDR